MKVIIVGAGIGGLTTALMLHQRGIRAEVYEQSPAVREVGVGINTLPHAIRELAEIGVCGVAGGWNLVHRVDHIPRNGLPVAVGKCNAGEVLELVGTQRAVHAPAAIGVLGAVAVAIVGLVVEVADQFLEHVLERDQPDHGAVFVGHQADVPALRAHLDQ